MTIRSLVSSVSPLEGRDWHCVVGLQILNRLLRGKWPDAVAIGLAILAFALILATAFAVRPGARVESGSQNPIYTGTEDPATPRAQVRNRMIKARDRNYRAAHVKGSGCLPCFVEAVGTLRHLVRGDEYLPDHWQVYDRLRVRARGVGREYAPVALTGCLRAAPPLHR